MSVFNGTVFFDQQAKQHVVGDRLKPRNTVFPVLRKAHFFFFNSALIETY